MFPQKTGSGTDSRICSKITRKTKVANPRLKNPVCSNYLPIAGDTRKDEFMPFPMVLSKCELASYRFWTQIAVHIFHQPFHLVHLPRRQFFILVRQSVNESLFKLCIPIDNEFYLRKDIKEIQYIHRYLSDLIFLYFKQTKLANKITERDSKITKQSGTKEHNYFHPLNRYLWSVCG